MKYNVTIERSNSLQTLFGVTFRGTSDYNDNEVMECNGETVARYSAEMGWTAPDGVTEIRLTRLFEV